LRAAMVDLDPAPSHFIMLATPNRPPLLARRLHRFWPYRMLTGEAGQLLSQPEFFARLPVPPVPYTIIAGDAGYRGRRGPFRGEPNDWLVAVEETKISPADRLTILPVGHTFMMNNPQVLAAIERALHHGEP
jgi:hypothetical protein